MRIMVLIAAAVALPGSVVEAQAPLLLGQLLPYGPIGRNH